MVSLTRKPKARAFISVAVAGALSAGVAGCDDDEPSDTSGGTTWDTSPEGPGMGESSGIDESDTNNGSTTWDTSPEGPGPATTTGVTTTPGSTGTGTGTGTDTGTGTGSGSSSGSGSDTGGTGTSSSTTG